MRQLRQTVNRSNDDGQSITMTKLHRIEHEDRKTGRNVRIMCENKTSSEMTH